MKQQTVFQVNTMCMCMMMCSGASTDPGFNDSMNANGTDFAMHGLS